MYSTIQKVLAMTDSTLQEAKSDKKNLIVSVSGGETSGFMAQWLWKNKRKDYHTISFVFANTGQEDKRTLDFVEKISDYFGFHIFWIEAKVFHGERKSSGYKIVSPDNASMNGEPFEDIIIKYGIPNMKAPHCTRELKQRPITAWAKKHVGKYEMAIGIRVDEADRINSKAKELGLIYPLISQIPMTKERINFFWKNMPFRLDLKGYEGNCKTCWKKSDKKLFQIAKDDPTRFDFMKEMELKFPRTGAEFKKDEKAKDRTFFRNNRSANDIIEQSKLFTGKVVDDHLNYDLIGGDSCELFSSCE